MPPALGRPVAPGVVVGPERLDQPVSHRHNADAAHAEIIAACERYLAQEPKNIAARQSATSLGVAAAGVVLAPIGRCPINATAIFLCRRGVASEQLTARRGFLTVVIKRLQL